MNQRVNDEVDQMFLPAFRWHPELSLSIAALLTTSSPQRDRSMTGKSSFIWVGFIQISFGGWVPSWL